MFHKQKKAMSALSPTQSSIVGSAKDTPVPDAEEKGLSPARDLGSESQALGEPEEEKISIDFTDPEVGRAIDKIQAGVVGMKVRREFKQSSEQVCFI